MLVSLILPIIMAQQLSASYHLTEENAYKMPIINEHSLLPILHIKSVDDWNDLYKICSKHLAYKDWHKFLLYLKEDVKTIIIETKYVDKDYRDTYYNFYSKKFALYSANTIRLHFFQTIIPETDLFNLDKHQEYYIGFSVIRPSRINSIGRTILDPEKLSKISGTMCRTRYYVHILGARLEICGFPYISQDTDVTVCAHAASWMVFRYFSERYPTYAEILPYDITQLTNNLSYGRLVPSKGLTLFQITEMFSAFGFYPEIYLKELCNDEEQFYRILYYYIESGLPVVGGLRCQNHAVTIIGHISDYDITPKTGSSVDYLTGLVINDDNCLPYQVLPKDSGSATDYCSKFKLENIDSFVVPLYEKIYLSAEFIDKLSDTLLESPDLGIDKLCELIDRKDIVKRIFLTSSKSFKMVRRTQVMPFDLQRNYCELPMPKFIWVCELSLIDLYPKQKIIGEIVFDATANQHDRFSFLLIHYPDFILFNDRDISSDDPARFITGRLPADKLLEYPMFTGNLTEA